MSKNYLPNRGNYNDLKPFKFWCQKVLPLVYDDSLSYYELLDKVVDYLNKTMEDVTTLNDDVTAMYGAYEQLQSYVNSYFDNLDVQNEINSKLDQMALDGSLSALIDPQIPGAVSSWLRDNVDPVGSAVVVDSTLTISGAAADAKVTGDNFNSLKADKGKFDITPLLTSNDVVEDYYVNGSNGALVSSTNYVCTDFVEIPTESEGLNLTANCFFGSIVGYAFYSTKSVNSFISGGTGTGYQQKTITTYIPQNAHYFRTTLKKTDYSSPNDFGITYQYLDSAIKKTVDSIVTNVNEINTSLTTAETNIEKNIDALRLIPTWTNGTIQSTGAIDSRTDRINTGLIKANVESIQCINDYYGLIAYYNVDRNFISLTSFAKNFTIDKSSFPERTFYIAVAMHNGTSSINPTEGTNCIILYSVDDVVKGTFDMTGEVVPFNEGSKNQIARLGWDVYNSKNPPEQTNQSYALAYKNGCRIMLADVRVTSDGKFVLWHDETLNNYVRHTDGTALTTEEKAMTIAGSTLSELNTFDYGIYRGSEYAGMKIPMLENFVKWCSLANCIPMLEIKVQLTEANCIVIANMCKQYGLGDRVIIDEYYSYLQNTVDYWKANLPKCTICIIAWNNVSTAQSFITNNLLNTDIGVLLTISGTSQLSLISTNDDIDYNKVRTVTNIGAKLTYTEVNNSSAMNTLYEAGYIDIFNYIASSYININRWLQDKLNLN